MDKQPGELQRNALSFAPHKDEKSAFGVRAQHLADEYSMLLLLLFSILSISMPIFSLHPQRISWPNQFIHYPAATIYSLQIIMRSTLA
jgi:hypothetical protein